MDSCLQTAEPNTAAWEVKRPMLSQVPVTGWDSLLCFGMVLSRHHIRAGRDLKGDLVRNFLYRWGHSGCEVGWGWTGGLALPSLNQQFEVLHRPDHLLPHP